MKLQEEYLGFVILRLATSCCQEGGVSVIVALTELEVQFYFRQQEMYR